MSACVETTHDGHLAVFITVQNLVGFDNIHVFQFREFGLKTPIHAPKLFFGGFDPLNGGQCEKFPKKAHPCASPRRLSVNMREHPSTRLTCM